jgi:hypothetical protein
MKSLKDQACSLAVEAVEQAGKHTEHNKHELLEQTIEYLKSYVHVDKWLCARKQGKELPL